MEDYSEQDSHHISSPTEELRGSAGASCCPEFPLSLLGSSQPCQMHPDLHKIIQVTTWDSCHEAGSALGKGGERHSHRQCLVSCPAGEVPRNRESALQAGAIQPTLLLLLPAVCQERGRLAFRAWLLTQPCPPGGGGLSPGYARKRAGAGVPHSARGPRHPCPVVCLEERSLGPCMQCVCSLLRRRPPGTWQTGKAVRTWRAQSPTWQLRKVWCMRTGGSRCLGPGAEQPWPHQRRRPVP